MAAKTSAGWLILALALAVPGVLFYQWYGHLDKAKKQEFGHKIRVRIPDGGPFAPAPTKDRLVNPIPSETQASGRDKGLLTPAPLQSAPMAPVRATPKAIAPGASLGRPGPSASASPAKAEPPAPAFIGPAPSPKAVTPAAPADIAAPAGSLEGPTQAWRDPTLSPYDQVKLDQMETEKNLAKMELQDRVTRSAPKAKAQPNVERTIDLQGIVTADGGNRAIVNGEMASEGDLVNTSVGSVKVVRINSQSVLFQWKNKRFSKRLSR